MSMENPETILAVRRQREADITADIARMEAELAEARSSLVVAMRATYAAEDAVAKAERS